MCRLPGISTCRHQAIKTISSRRQPVRTIGRLSTCNNRRRTVSGIMARLVAKLPTLQGLVFTRHRARYLPSSTSKFKCNESIHRSDQPRATFSITNWLEVVPCQRIAKFRARRPNTPIQCRSLPSFRQIKASRGHTQELMNLRVTVNSRSIRAVRMVLARPFLKLVMVLQTSAELTRP